MKKQKNSLVSHNVRYAYHLKSLFNDSFIPFRLVSPYVCLDAVRNFASIVKGKLRLFI